VISKSPKDNAVFRRKVFRLAVACLFLVMAVTLIFGQKGVMELHRHRRELARLDDDLRSLARQKAALDAEILQLENNPRAIEKEARKNQWLVKPGEKTIVIPKDPKK